MIDILREYLAEANEAELQELIGFGYGIVYQDVNLSAIYDVLADSFHETELEQQIRDIFGYYGLGLLLQVDGMNYWIMQL